MKFPLIKICKQIITRIVKTFKLDLPVAPTGRPRKISHIDALALGLYKQKSTRATKISLYRDLKESLNCSYKTFVVSLIQSAILGKHIVEKLMQVWGKDAHPIKYTDATDIPVCLKKNGDAHKTMAGLAGLGHSSKGWFHGIKMTLTRDYDGRWLGLSFNHPMDNDRDIFRTINKKFMGILVGDAGYVSKQLEADMDIEGKRVTLISPYRTMKRIATLFQLAIYKGRFQIEFDFRSLKLFHGLITSMPRSVNGYLANYIHSILSYLLV